MADKPPSSVPQTSTKPSSPLAIIRQTLEQIVKQMDHNTLVMVIATGIISLGFALLLLKILTKKTKKTIPISEMATIITDREKGIRALNPDFHVTLPKQDDYSEQDFKAPLCESFLEGLQTHPDKEIFGWHEKSTDPFKWITCSEFVTRFTEFGSGLNSELGIKPGDQAKIGIYAINCIEWVVAHFGLLMYSNVAVPLYSTLGKDAMIHIVNLTQMSACVCLDEEKAESLMKMLKKAQETGSKALDTMKALILIRVKESQAVNKLRETYPNMKILSMDEIRESGRKNILKCKIPSDEGLYIINFTSGTTSTPKGVLVTNKMIKRVLESAFLTKTLVRFMGHGDTHFSFLPLAHILEQMAIIFVVFFQCRAGFFTGDITKIMDEMKVLRPTFLSLVPRLLIRIYDKTLERMDKHYIPRWLFKYAINYKLRAIAKHGPFCQTIWDRLFFNRLKEALGGRLEILFTGSAVCPPEVIDFTRAAFGAMLYIGYGATETGGPVSLTFSQSVQNDNVGAPIQGLQIKLADVPEMNLFPDKIKSHSRGEICAKAVNCTEGYYNDPERTKELIDSEGWLHTGDIGEWDEYGYLKIVDRCKNIFKLCQGEYIAPDKVESVYMTCPLIEQVFIDGKSDESYAIALVHPNVTMVAKQLSACCENKGEALKQEMSIKEICNSTEIRDQILKQMTAIAKEHNLASFEMAKKLHLISEPMSIENGMLTSTLKTVRGAVRKTYKKEIDLLYSKGL